MAIREDSLDPIGKREKMVGIFGEDVKKFSEEVRE